MSIAIETAAGEPAEGRAALIRDLKITGSVCSAHTFSHFNMLVLPTVFPLLRADLDLSYATLGLMLTVASAASGLSQVPVGFLVDRIGAPIILACGLGMQATAIALLGLAPNVATLMLLALLFGLGNSVFHPADYSILSSRITESRMGRALGAHNFSGYLGWTLAPLVVLGLAELFGWRWALAICGLAGIAVTLFVWHMRALLQDPRRDGRRDARAQGAVQIGILSKPVVLSFFFFMMIAISSTGVASFGITSLHALYDASVQSAGLVITAYLLSSCAGILVGGWLADRTSNHGAIAGGGFFASSCLFLALGSGVPGFVAVLPIMAMIGFTGGLIQPSRDMIVRSAAPPGAAGRVFALATSGLDVGSATTPLLFGWLLDHNLASWIFVCCGMATLLASVTIVATGRSGRRARQAAEAAA